MIVAFSGCATRDPNAAETAPSITPADTSAKPGSGPGAAASSGLPVNTGPSQ